MSALGRVIGLSSHHANTMFFCVKAMWLRPAGMIACSLAVFGRIVMDILFFGGANLHEQIRWDSEKPMKRL